MNIFGFTFSAKNLPYGHKWNSYFCFLESLRKVWKLESEVLKRMYPSIMSAADLECPTDIFFVEVVPIPATKFRPVSNWILVASYMTIYPCFYK
jgi:hypothetical protein